MNLADLLRKAAADSPDKDALVGRFGTVSFATLDAEADRVGRWLRASGVGTGDRVAIAMPNVPEFSFAYFGILRAGAVAVPLDTMLTEAEIAAILSDSGAIAALGAPPVTDSLETVTRRSGTVRAFATVERWDDLGPPRGDAVVESPASDHDVAVLSYTSGTTGRPKGVMLTHRNLGAALRQQLAVPGAPDRRDTVVLALPLSHIFGLNVGLGVVVAAEATGLLLERFDPVESLRAIQRNAVTVVSAVPQMYKEWLAVPDDVAADIGSVRLAVSGAAALQPEVLHAFRARFGIDIWEGYGLTETAPTLTSALAAGEIRPGSVGKPLEGVEVRIVDEQGNEAEPGDPGEILVRGPNVFAGYWNRPEETKSAFVDGWFRTGDVAVRDEDGFIYLVDRKRDLVIVSGFNVFPAEVENALLALPGVADAAVVGVPDDRTGEAVKAYVVLSEGASADEASLLAGVAARLARFKCPRSIAIVDRLPRLPTGKVLRRALRT